MARTKDSARQSRLQAETRAVFAEPLPVSLDMPDPKELASPCPTPSRKRKRSQSHTETSSPVQLHVESESYKQVTPARLDRYKARRHERIIAPKWEEPTWNKFKLSICDCEDQHSMHTIVLPLSCAETLTRIDDAVYLLTGRQPSEGTYTDLEGDELLQMSELWEDYFTSGLPGLIWHRDYYAGVEYYDNAAAQRLIRRCLVLDREDKAFREVSQAESDYDDLGSHAEAFASEQGTIEQTTPPPLPVVLKETNKASSPQMTPWTVMTSSSTGQITKLENSESKSSIKRQALVNVFDEDELLLWKGRDGRAGHESIG